MITHKFIFDLEKKIIVAILCSGIVLLWLLSNDESVCVEYYAFRAAIFPALCWVAFIPSCLAVPFIFFLQNTEWLFIRSL